MQGSTLTSLKVLAKPGWVPPASSRLGFSYCTLDTLNWATSAKWILLQKYQRYSHSLPNMWSRFAIGLEQDLPASEFPFTSGFFPERAVDFQAAQLGEYSSS